MRRESLACLVLVVCLSPVLGQPPKKTLRLPETPYNYAKIELPPHFLTSAVQSLDNTPEANPITDAGATLGRVLFYDTRLSANGTVRR